MGFTICIIAGLYVYREYNVDKCYKNYQNIYRIVDDEKNVSHIDYDLAKRLKDKFPEINNITPALPFNIFEFTLKSGKKDNTITVKNIISTENDFFNIFSLDFLAGDPANPFSSDRSIVVTKSVAEKLFGHTDIIGELVLYNSFPISAVVQDMPENSSIKADIFINSASDTRFSQSCRNGNNNCHNPYPIFVLLNDGTDKNLLEEKINNDFPENKSETTKIRLQPLTDIYFDKTVTDNNNLAGSRTLVFIFITIAIIILTLSVINHINFSLSQQLNTLKQLGIKMVNGASIQQLRGYYIVEIGLSVFLSFILSLVICIFSLPLFDHILEVHLNLKNILTPIFILSIISILTIVILISSLTPFYIISKFDIQMLFGKKQLHFGKQWSKMTLTGCQMIITIIMFIFLFMLQKQLDYVKSYDLGFDKDHLIKINIAGETNYEVFRNEIAQYDFVQSTAYSSSAPGFMYYTEDQQTELKDQYIVIKKIYTEPGFINTFDLKLLLGRNFTDADYDKSCIISEETMNQLGWEHIEGKMCNGYQVIGVIKDFNVSSLHNKIEPVNIICTKTDGLKIFLNIRLKGNIPEALNKLRQSWKKVIPDKPFEYHFYDEVFDTYYQKEERQSTAIAFISLIAIIITCMGLIGQVMQTSKAKAKEIGIRKINGASIAEVMLIIPNNFLKCFAVAFVIAIPIAWYAMDKWLQNFAFKTAISWWIFALSGLAVLLILTLSVLWQTRKAATANPVDIIKNE